MPGSASPLSSHRPSHEAIELPTQIGPRIYPNDVFGAFCFISLLILQMILLFIHIATLLYYLSHYYASGILSVFQACILLNTTAFCIYVVGTEQTHRTLEVRAMTKEVECCCSHCRLITLLIVIPTLLSIMYIDRPVIAASCFCIAFAFGCITSFINLLTKILSDSCEIFVHWPEECNKHYSFFSRQHSNSDTLEIVESGAFRIVLKNIDEWPRTGTLRIVRENGYASYSRNNSNYFERKAPTIEFLYEIAEELPPGGHLILIPETHEMEGAHPVKGYRSFGKDLGLHIITSVYEMIPGETKEGNEPIAKLSEYYKVPHNYMGDSVTTWCV